MFASLQWGSEVSVFNRPNINCSSPLFLEWTSLVTQMVKNPPVMQETRIWSLGWKDPLEKRLATHSSIFVWRIPWTEEPGGLQSMGSQKVGHNWATNTFTFRLHIHTLSILHTYTCNSHSKDLLWGLFIRYFVI